SFNLGVLTVFAFIVKRFRVFRAPRFYDALCLCYNIGIGNFKSSSVLKLVNGEQLSKYSSINEAWLCME
ncbi:hypothetical protein P4S72_01245, partial [Vibrio sp. PP-XX7]